MTEHKILRFTEIYSRLDDYDQSVEYGQAVFLVSTRLIPSFKETNDFAYDYVDDMIERALKGQIYQRTGRKYSFGDMASSYVTLEPDKDCTDPVIDIEVEVG
jgi:hypothetical protein